MEDIFIFGVIFIVAVCEIFLFKNIMVNYKDCSGYKILLLIILAVTTALCAVAVIIEGCNMYENTKNLNLNNLTPDMISSLNYEIASEKVSIIRGAIVGLSSFLLTFLVFLFIKKEWKREIDRPKKKWNWNKIK
ncbi:MAG: hypothetical protein LIR50_21075 [Bacillota bacterium]|nr:hypothetical protein [Bacillota bacterium]